jgi:hypothetical protein
MLYYPNCPGGIPAGIKGTRGAAYTATGLKVRPIPGRHVRGLTLFRIFYEGLYLCHKTGVNTARTLYWQKINFFYFL